MLRELLKRFDRKREILINAKEYGVYSERDSVMLYDDSKNQYFAKSRKERNLKVSSVDSFVDFIREELKRLNNETGKKTTVIINKEGGSFSADDDFKLIGCNYERSYTSAWDTLKRVIGKRMGHEELLCILQKLRPYILNFEELYLKLIDIRTIGRSVMISNPIFVNGESSTGYKIKFKLQSGEEDESEVPNRFIVDVPYEKGRLNVEYSIPVELMFLNNENGKLEILFQCSEFERIEEQAMLDEVDYLREQLKDFSDILVLLNL